MANCVHCGAETEMYYSGVPICTTCSERREAQTKSPELRLRLRERLLQELEESSTRVRDASEAFLLLMDETPGELPQPDGVLRIQNASQELSIARAEMEKAHLRLTDYLSRGILPGD